MLVDEMNVPLSGMTNEVSLTTAGVTIEWSIAREKGLLAWFWLSFPLESPLTLLLIVTSNSSPERCSTERLVLRDLLFLARCSKSFLSSFSRSPVSISNCILGSTCYSCDFVRSIKLCDSLWATLRMNLNGTIPELLIRWSESLESSIPVDWSLVW